MDWEWDDDKEEEITFMYGWEISPWMKDVQPPFASAVAGAPSAAGGSAAASGGSGADAVVSTEAPLHLTLTCHGMMYTEREGAADQTTAIAPGVS